MVRIILTRHGETIENAEGRFNGHLHGHLSEKGILQAKKLAERLKDEKIDKIISSDLARTYDTAKEIAKFHQSIPFTKDEKIRERCLGEMQGKTKKELGWSMDISNVEGAKIEGIESKKDLFERAKSFVSNLANEEGTILLVGHAGINKALMANLLGWSLEEYIQDTSFQKNTAVTIIELNNQSSAQMILDNCTSHLEE